MAKLKTDLLSDLAGLLPKHSRPNWLARVPADLLEEMEGVKAGFISGTLAGPLARASRAGLASAIASWMSARGIPVHETTVVRWLKK
jgi:hypothetical protein